MTPRSADAPSMFLSGLPLASLPSPLSDLEIAFRDRAAQASVSATAREVRGRDRNAGLADGARRGRNDSGGKPGSVGR